MKNIIGPDIKVLSGPLLVIIITSSMFLLGFNSSYDAIVKRVNGFKETQKMERTLEAKLDILKGVEVGSLERSNRLVQILPSTNPGSVGISQIKQKANNNLLVLSDLSILGETEASDGVSTIGFNFSLEAINMVDMITILEELDKMAPINNLDKVELKIGDDTIEADVESNLFWATYPLSIPSVNSPIIDLTEAENKKIQVLGNYELPGFSILNPAAPNDRESPFY